MKVALIRHPAPLVEPGICYGRLDLALDPARARPITVAGLPAVTRIWTSPAQRCRAPAEQLARALTVPLIIDSRLQELDFGKWEGRRWETVPQADLDRWTANPLAFTPPGGESGASLLDRVTDFHNELRRDGRDCAVVSHGGPLKLLAALLFGTPPDLLAPPPLLASVTIMTCPVLNKEKILDNPKSPR